MKRQLIIAAVIFSIMAFINFIGGLVNSNVGHFQGNLSDFPESLGIVAVFSGFYLLTTIIETKLGTSYRLPILRTVFWTLVVTLDIFFRGDGALVTVDYLLALINSGLCLFYNTLLFKVYNGRTGNTYFEIYGFGIFIFAVYEFLIIKTSTVLADRLTGLKLMTRFSVQKPLHGK